MADDLETELAALRLVCRAAACSGVAVKGLQNSSRQQHRVPLAAPNHIHLLHAEYRQDRSLSSRSYVLCAVLTAL
jgi:hypothetical protein